MTEPDRARRLWRFAALTLGAAFLATAWPHGNSQPHRPAPAAHRCEEDEACWSPRLMGNGFGEPAWK